MSEIDPELRSAWKDASREEPPAALDDAIRAAARREVGARPGAFRAAPRWLPLAAAATVAALAVGIAQMTPPDEVTPAIAPAPTNALQRSAKPDADAEKRTVTATQALPGGVPAAAPAPKPSLRDAPAGAPALAPAAAPAPQAPHDTDTAKLALKEQARGAAAETDRVALPRNRSDGFAAPPEEQSREKKVLAARQAPQRAEEASERDQAFKKKAELAAASPIVRTAPAASNAPMAQAERNQSQAFPASPMPAQAAGGNTPAPPATIAAAREGAATASLPAPAPAMPARAVASSSSASGALSGSVDARQSANAEPLPAKDAGALGKTSAADNAGDKLASERRKDSAPLAPDEWIKRIRRFIAEGRNEDAAKELAAFRREYKERSESLLPSDLRQFKP